MMEEKELEVTVRSYLEAFDRRDLAACVDFYAEDAQVFWGTGTYQGRQAIEGFHQDRFNADLKVFEVESLKTSGNTVTVDMVGTSRLAKAWRLNTVKGRATMVIEDGRFTSVKFGLRMGLALERW